LKLNIFVLNIDDMLINGEKFPIVADAIRIFLDAGFRYRDRIIWKKPEGYLRISRRNGVMLQNPYSMYFYPDNFLDKVLRRVSRVLFRTLDLRLGILPFLILFSRDSNSEIILLFSS